MDTGFQLCAQCNAEGMSIFNNDYSKIVIAKLTCAEVSCRYAWPIWIDFKFERLSIYLFKRHSLAQNSGISINFSIFQLTMHLALECALEEIFISLAPQRCSLANEDLYWMNNISAFWLQCRRHTFFRRFRDLAKKEFKEFKSCLAELRIKITDTHVPTLEWVTSDVQYLATSMTEIQNHLLLFCAMLFKAINNNGHPVTFAFVCSFRHFFGPINWNTG